MVDATAPAGATVEEAKNAEMQPGTFEDAPTWAMPLEWEVEELPKLARVDF